MDNFSVLTKPCDPELPVFGAAHYFERADAGAALVRAGFIWNTDEACWILGSGDDQIRASVGWSETFNRYYIRSVL
jgi:hypothetical protein